MKKYFYSMVVMAIFAIGFAASGDSEDEETYVDEWGHKYHKVVLKCTMCGASPRYASYWEADGGSSINKPSSNFLDGKFYCSDCIDKLAERYKRRVGL